MTQLARCHPTWASLEQSDLRALEQRKEFLNTLKGPRRMIEGHVPTIGKRKGDLIKAEQLRYEKECAQYEERAKAGSAEGLIPPQKPNLTAHVAENLTVTPRERADLTSFLRAAYLPSHAERWENIHGAELFNTARHIYRKIDGTHCLKLDILMQQAAQDRQHRKRLNHILPLMTGIGFSYAIETDTMTGNGGRVATPAFVVGYSTQQHFWIAYDAMAEESLDAIAAVHGAEQILVAQQHLEEFSANLADRYRSRVNGLEIRAEPMSPEKRFEI